MLPEPRYTRKVDAFTATGTFTPPAGCTYAIAHILAGGGGIGLGGTAGTGGTSSVAFAAGTKSSTGGLGCDVITPGSFGSNTRAIAGTANSGQGATMFSTSIDDASTTVGAGGTGTIAMGQSGDTVNMNVAGVTYQYPSNLVRYTDLTATNNKINITTQVPGSIVLSLPNKPVVGQLCLTDNVPTSSNNAGTLTVAGGVGITGNVYAGTLNANTGFQLGSALDGTTPINLERCTRLDTAMPPWSYCLRLTSTH
jgi:hypothetical protein